MTDAWPALLTQPASSYLVQLQPGLQRFVCDVLDIACRSPYGWPQFDETDPEGRDLRWAVVGELAVVYWINRAAGHLLVLDIQWGAGSP